jgi:gliding-associated putative ABC transporter substrate-binding component GldG
MKKKPWSATAISNLVLVAAILVVINLIGVRLFTRLDLTENRIYTLSQASRKTVANLHDRLTVKAYFSRDLPPPYNANARYLQDALEDYRSYGGGKFHFEFVDPGSEEKLEREAQAYRIPPVQVNVMAKDKLEVKKVYMGLVLIYQDKHEAIPLIQNVTNLEYDLTSTIKRLTAEKLRKVGILTGFGGPDFQNDLEQAKNLLAKNYQVVPVSLSGNDLIDPDIETLLIIGPTEKFDDWAKFVIDQYIMNGGKVAWLINKVNARLQESQAIPNNLQLDDLTRQYGFVVNNNLITDAQCGVINVQQRQAFFTIRNMVQYPPFPEIRHFNDKSPIVKDLESMMLFFPSSIDTLSPSAKGLQAIPLFYSSDRTRVQQGRYDINPMSRAVKEGFSESGKLLAVAYVGSFESFFAGKSIPQPTDSAVAPPNVTIVERSPETRMVIVGDGNFAQDAYASHSTNPIFFMNTVDWLTQDSDLMQIRSREAAIRPLREVSDATKQTVKLANIIGPPVLVVLLGVIRWLFRRQRKVREI